MSSDVTLNDLAERINSSWQRTTQSALETARLCAEARDQLVEEELEVLKSKLDFSRPTFTKLVKIGAKCELYEEQVSVVLPPHFSIVYQIASMNDEQRELAIDQGIIMPGMSRSELREWVASQSGTPTAAQLIWDNSVGVRHVGFRSSSAMTIMAHAKTHDPITRSPTRCQSAVAGTAVVVIT